MTGSSLPRWVLISLLVWVCAPAALLSEQAGGTVNDVRVELTLDARTVAVSFEPALRAADPVHASVLAGEGGEIRVGRIEAPSSLHIGTVEAGSDPETTHNLDLWLRATGGAWELGAYPPDVDTPEASDAVGRIPLASQAGDPQETLSVAAVATADDAGRLLLGWGTRRWSADFRFVEQDVEERRPPDNTPRGASRLPDTDTSAIARERVLNERNETALVVGTGHRVSVTFWKGLTADSDDFAGIAGTGDGSVVPIINGAALRLRSETPLQVGDAVLDTENQVPGYPGTYALWLKKNGSRWSFVFNHEADSWGTQHDPVFDAAEIDVDYSRTNEDSRPLAVSLIPVSADHGELRVQWGPHEWAAVYAIP